MLKFSSVLSSDVNIATHDQRGVGTGTVPGPIYKSIYKIYGTLPL
jgi:hypothetical protein